MTGWFHRVQRHLSQGTHASAVRGPHSPWLAGIPEQRQIETERAECERPRVKTNLTCRVDSEDAEKFGKVD